MTGSLPPSTALPSRPDPAFERFARLVRRQLDVPVALVTLVSGEQQVFPGAVGLPEPWQSTRCTPLSHSFCQHVVRSAAPLVITDARTEPLVADNLAIPDLHVIAYAGVPLTDADGTVVGSLCAIDHRPRTWSDEDLAVLTDLAGACSSELQLGQAQQRVSEAGARAEQVSVQQDVDRARSALALAAGQVGTFDMDLATGALTVDDRLLELSGMDRATFTGRPEDVYARVHPDDVADVVARVEHAVDTGGTYAAEYRIVLGDGSCRWLTARGEVVGGTGNAARRLVGVVHDITAQRSPLQLAAQALESMAVGYLTMDVDWRITYVNDEAEHALGLPRDQLVGGIIWELFPGTVGTEFEAGYRRAADTGEPYTFDAHYPEPLNAWYEVRANPEHGGVALYFTDITTRVGVQQQSERAAAREQLLGRITEELVGTLDADEAAQRLSRLVVPAIADWCIVTLGDDDLAAGARRGLRSAASWHRDAAMRETTAAYAQARLGSLEDDAVLVRAMRTGQLQLIDAHATAQVEEMLAEGPAQELMGALAPEAVAVLPLPGRHGPVGILSLANGAARGSFTPEDLVTARHAAARSGLVLDNARLFRQQRGLAEGFQRSLLTPPPEPDHVQIVVRYVPAGQAAEVGGDWYDAFLQPSGATVLVIGDVVGHDVQAAAAMGQARTIVRALAARDHDGPAAVMTEVEQVMQTLQSGIMATAVVARLEQTDEEHAAGLARLRWSNAGHPPPMVVSPDGEVRVLDGGRPDLLLGVRPDAPRREAQVTLPWRSVVLLYTDGLVETRHEDIDHGLARLQRLLGELAGRDLDELCDEVLARMLPTNPGDDVALVAIQLHPQDRPRPPQAGPNRVPPNVPAD
ncbi:SpoIIE family protein phosphatase [Geodermatophilus nigrescens]|uniref:protein-serine/threonine phosphatase n=1 Tax=Geodermatophilus nigrescens TaxID=1070870 RepID=A0A1M5FY61_9ACTN|nr:SpoIIE family protein phosphatase [Geodermatophilus nigrescens]SHF96497.1 PAS domain S-box-containing protein [Geodermatophilus nigrescens]